MDSVQRHAEGRRSVKRAVPDAKAAAEAAWRQSVADGQPVTGAQLGQMFGLSDSWGRTVIAAARRKDSEQADQRED